MILKQLHMNVQILLYLKLKMELINMFLYLIKVQLKQKIIIMVMQRCKLLEHLMEIILHLIKVMNKDNLQIQVQMYMHFNSFILIHQIQQTYLNIMELLGIQIGHMLEMFQPNLKEIILLLENMNYIIKIINNGYILI